MGYDTEYRTTVCDEFPKIDRTPRELPVAFDDCCKKCDEKMERMPAIYCTEIRPYATFQCATPSCSNLRLMIFKIEGKDLFVWSDNLHGVTNFSAARTLLEKHQEKRDRRELRELGVVWADPPI